MKSAQDTAFEFLLKYMNKGKMNFNEAQQLLRDNHLCTLATLERANLIWADERNNFITTIERHHDDLEKAEKRRAIRVAKEQIRLCEKIINELKNR